ncbi:hypothetical protein VCHA53O466_50094 [Vibrio chagasii]|nr:hypothetical protein VCHA53O466_50094 [Vibrio chagasii]
MVIKPEWYKGLHSLRPCIVMVTIYFKSISFVMSDIRKSLNATVLVALVGTMLSKCRFRVIESNGERLFEQEQGEPTLFKSIESEQLLNEGVTSYSPFSFSEDVSVAGMLREVVLGTKSHIDGYGSLDFKCDFAGKVKDVRYLNDYGTDENEFDEVAKLCFIVDQKVYVITPSASCEAEGAVLFTYDVEVSCEPLMADTANYRGKYAYYHYSGLGVSLRYAGNNIEKFQKLIHQQAEGWSSGSRHFYQTMKVDIQ